MTNLYNIQTDYNTAKAAIATFQTAFNTAASALYNVELAAEQLEADGAGDIATVIRQQAMVMSQGFQKLARSPVVSLFAVDPNFPRDPNAALSVQSVQSTTQGQALRIVP
jgi:hypothetical protein